MGWLGLWAFKEPLRAFGCGGTESIPFLRGGCAVLVASLLPSPAVGFVLIWGRVRRGLGRRWWVCWWLWRGDGVAICVYVYVGFYLYVYVYVYVHTDKKSVGTTGFLRVLWLLSVLTWGWNALVFVF